MHMMKSRILAILICVLVCSPVYIQAVEKEATERRTPDVIYVPTPQNVVDKMLELAEVKKDDLVYDLGCGDGRIVVTAAKKFGCTAIGYDIDPQRVKESLQNVEKNKVGDLVTIEEKDIFTLDLSKANVVTLYLLPQLNVKLIPQLDKLKPGSRIVSHDFDMKGVEPDKVVTVSTDEGGYSDEHTVYLWTTPLKKTSEMSKAREALRDLNQELREAETEARLDPAVAKAFKAVEEAQQAADKALDAAIVKANPELKGAVRERRALIAKIRKLRGGRTRPGGRQETSGGE
jgi:SAM-dependent methyltransferase